SKIDFGYFYDTTTTSGVTKHTIYALTASTFVPYDLSTWTKNATVFKRITSPGFAAITSAAELQKQGVATLTSGAVAKVNCAAGTVTNAGILTGTTYMFKTAAGKYGVLTVLYTGPDSPSPGTYIVIDAKIQR
ncbi:MAG: hypothetical protein JST39_01140, partial [Bacteroidetes bacterium]|nr:hypothetical protein [Bacteroidota bacterium]